jgi:hypothetical protein
MVLGFVLMQVVAVVATVDPSTHHTPEIIMQVIATTKPEQYALHTIDRHGVRGSAPVATGTSQRALIRAGGAYVAWELVDADGAVVCRLIPRAA